MSARVSFSSTASNATSVAMPAAAPATSPAAVPTPGAMDPAAAPAAAPPPLIRIDSRRALPPPARSRVRPLACSRGSSPAPSTLRQKRRHDPCRGTRNEAPAKPVVARQGRERRRVGDDPALPLVEHEALLLEKIDEAVAPRDATSSR